VRVIEIIPPAVQIELHDEKFQPGRVLSMIRGNSSDVQTNLKNGRLMGMQLKDFTEELWASLSAGNEFDEYPISVAKHWYTKIEPARREGTKILPLAPAQV